MFLSFTHLVMQNNVSLYKMMFSIIYLRGYHGVFTDCSMMEGVKQLKEEPHNIRGVRCYKISWKMVECLARENGDLKKQIRY